MKKFPYLINRSIDLSDVTHLAGSDNTPGGQRKVLFARFEDIDIMPQPDVDNSAGTGSLDQLVTISQNIRMLPYKKFYELYITPETGKLTDKLIGELDGMSFENVVDLFHPGTSPQILGLIQWAKNSDLIILFPEIDGKVRVIGHKGYPAKMSVGDVTTGQKAADRKGATMSFRSVRKGPSPIFTGKIDLMGSGYGSGDADNYQTTSIIA
jgi:hypothetical protein